MMRLNRWDIRLCVARGTDEPSRGTDDIFTTQPCKRMKLLRKKANGTDDRINHINLKLYIVYMYIYISIYLYIYIVLRHLYIYYTNIISR